jgi:DeoR family transcriptional regulator of aga operon
VATEPRSEPRPELIPAHRRAVILERIRAQAGASIQELAAATGASGSTIRRDLEHLEREGYLQRSHGGALLQPTMHSRFEPETSIAAELARAEKHAIGIAAAARLTPGQSVIFDSGSTVRAAARATAERGIRLTAVTNDLGVGQIFSAVPEVEVVVLGGRLRHGSLTLFGDPGMDFMKDIQADVALIGTHAISSGVLTDTSIEISTMKRAMIASARRVLLLADADKFRPAAFFRICDLGLVQEVITDARADPAAVRDLRDAGLTVTVVEVMRSADVVA